MPYTCPVLKYFAYGSNMYVPRLRYRVPGCAVIGIGLLFGHQLRFHKISKKDGSAKGDAFATGVVDDMVMGVLYDIPNAERPDLDAAEGLGFGYRDELVRVTLPDGTEVEALTYLAMKDAIDPLRRPYTWYHEFVLTGARDHQLPEGYIADRILAVPPINDPDPKRDHAERQKLRFW